MKKYNLTSFVDRNFAENIEYNVVGNPATIFLFDKNENINKKEMSRISIEEHAPICCFVKNTFDNNYDICFFNLDGSQAYMCGHGTLATAYILYKTSNINNINLYYDTSKFKNKIVDNLINVQIDEDDKVMIEMNMFNYSIIDKYDCDNDIKQCRNLLGLNNEDVECVICGKEYYDLTFILKDCQKLRDLKPNFKELSIVLAEDKMDVRNLCVSSKSIEDKFDFETRVFCPHDNLNEDIACGSSNLTISRYWSDATAKKNFKILFPFNFSIDRNVGGIQFIKIDNNKIYIGGYCK